MKPILDTGVKKELETQKNMLNIKYLRYDWSLNGKQTAIKLNAHDIGGQNA